MCKNTNVDNAGHVDTVSLFKFEIDLPVCLPVVHVFESWCGICQIFLGPFSPHPTVHLFVRDKVLHDKDTTFSAPAGIKS